MQVKVFGFEINHFDPDDHDVDEAVIGDTINRWLAGNPDYMPQRTEAQTVTLGRDRSKLFLFVWYDDRAETSNMEMLSDALPLLDLLEMAARSPGARTSELATNLLRRCDELELSVRSTHCLENASLTRVIDVVMKTEAELLKKKFGRKSLREIKELMQTFGLKFAMRESEIRTMLQDTLTLDSVPLT